MSRNHLGLYLVRVSVADAAKAFGDLIARVPAVHRNSSEFRYPKIKVR